jgi:hypothetical protein
MTIIKLTGSKKGIQVVDDDGNVFQTSVNFVLGLINGKAKGDFIMTSRLPYKVAPGRFKPSPLYDPEGLADNNIAKSQTTNDDAFSKKVQESQKTKKAYVDKSVW